MRISVIAPNLDEMPQFETFFLRSLSRQTFRDFEVIIVDGGSTDGSLEKIKEYSKRDKRFRYVIDTTRNIGYIRNVGARLARGDIIFETSSDVYFPPRLLEQINRYYIEHPDVIALAGRTYPSGSRVSLLAHIGYAGFDIIRYLMTVLPFKKIRPSGNFLTIKRKVFEELNGYPEVRINEDGLFGYKLDNYLKEHKDKTVVFNRNLYIVHHVKRFEKKGGLKALLFYLYIFGVIFPFLKPLLAPIERKSGKEFASRSDLK
ncbi:MAG: glycosyltransferase family 2 protein [Candidatus Heimdallarchaeaceae archaeon]